MCVITRPLSLTSLTWRFVDLDAPPDHPSTVYDLLANVIHESVAGTTRDKVNTNWKIHLRAGGGGGDNEKWFQMQDLIVEEVRKEMIFLGETVLQVSIELNVILIWSAKCLIGVDLGEEGGKLGLILVIGGRIVTTIYLSDVFAIPLCLENAWVIRENTVFLETSCRGRLVF